MFSILRKRKEKRCFENANKRCLIDNKLFWKTVKFFFLDKIITKVYLTQNNKHAKADKKTKYLLSFFSGTQYLDITKYKIESDHVIHKSTDSVKITRLKLKTKF